MGKWRPNVAKDIFGKENVFLIRQWQTRRRKMQNVPNEYYKEDLDEMDDLVVLLVGIPVSHLARLEGIAEEEGTSLDWVINDAIELTIIATSYLAEHGTA